MDQPNDISTRWANEGGTGGIVYEVPNDGLFQIKWPNGNLRYEWYYKDGKRADGVSKGWYENGQIKQVRNYKDNQLHGLMLHYYHNGLKKSEQNWEQNNLNGLYTMWYYARTSKIDTKYNKWKEGTYKDGIRDGKWTFWNPYGQVEREILYVPPYSSLNRARMILVGTKKASILWATKKGSTTINRLLDQDTNLHKISKFNFTDDYDGIILVPCRTFDSLLQTSYCEFVKKETSNKKYNEFISEMMINYPWQKPLDQGGISYNDIENKWKYQIEEFIKLDRSDEFISKMDFIPRIVDIRKAQGKTGDGTNSSLYYLSVTDSRFKFFDLENLKKIKNYLVEVDSNWDGTWDNIAEEKYNNTFTLQRNIKVIKDNNKKYYKDRVLLGGIEPSIVHIKKSYLELVKHIKQTDDFFYEKLSKKFIIKGD